MPDVESNIRINITAAQNQSAINIKKVDSALQQLKQTADELQGSGLTSVTNELAKLVSVLNQIDVSKANAVSVLANGLKSLSSIGSVNVEVQGVQQATQEAEQGTGVMNRFAGAVQGVKTVLTTLAKPITDSDIWKKAIDQTDVQKTKDLIGGVAHGIGQIVGVSKDIPSEKFHSMAEGVEQVGQKTSEIQGTTTALGELATKADTVSAAFEHTDMVSFANSISETDLLAKKLELATAKLNNLQIAGKEGSKEWVTAVENVQKYSNAVQNANQEGIGDGIKEDVSEVGDNLEETTSRFEDFTDKIREASSSGTEQFFGQLASKIGGLATPLGVLSALTAAVKLAVTYFKMLGKVAVSGITAAAKAVSALTKGFIKLNAILVKIVAAAGKAFGSLMLTPIQMLGKALGNVVNRLKSVFGGLVRIASYRLFRSVIKMITAGLKEGIDNLYQWSKLLDQSFSKTMDLFATDKQYLNNSIAAMLEPMLEKLIPMLDQAVDKLVDLMNKFNQFVSALTGKSTWTKALKVPKEYAEAADKADKKTKELQRTLLGFDEINRLNGDHSSKKDDDDKVDYSKMFEELPIESEFKNLAKTIKDLIEAGQWFSAGAVLGNKITELFENWDAEKTGKILAKKINDAVDFARGFLKSTGWRKLGSKIANLINGLLHNLNARNIGRAISDVLNSAFYAALGLLETLDGAALGATLASIINGFFSGMDWGAIADTINAGLFTALNGGISFFKTLDSGNIYDSLLDLITGVEWGDIGLKFAELFNTALTVIDPSKLSEIFLKIVGGLSEFLINSVGNMDIVSFVTKFTDLLRNLFTDTKTIQNFAKAIEILVTTALQAVGTFIETYPTSELFNAITTFFDGIEWDKIGLGIGTALQNAINKIEPSTIAKTISTVINSAIKLLSSVSDSLSELTTITISTGVDKNGVEQTKEKLVTYWEKLGFDIGDAIANALNGIDWETAGETLNNLLIGLTTMIKTAFDRLATDKELQENVQTLIDSIDWNTLAKNLIDIIKDVHRTLHPALLELGKALWDAIWEGIREEVRDTWTIAKAAPSKASGKATAPKVDVPNVSPTEPGSNTFDLYPERNNMYGVPLEPTSTSNYAVTGGSSLSSEVATGVYEGVVRANGENGDTVQVSVDGDSLFDFFVKRHNGVVRQTGVSPLYR